MISGVEGRADDLRKIRGVLFTPVTVEEVVRKEFPQVVEFEILVERKNLMDEICLRVEPQEEMGKETAKDFCRHIGERLKTKTNLRFQIEMVPPGGLPRYTLKSKRFKDLREVKNHE
jgi:phenylacetate-CoA ligase